MIAACEAEGLVAKLDLESGILPGELIISGLDSIIDQNGNSSFGPIGQYVSGYLEDLNKTMRSASLDYQGQTDGMSFCVSASMLKPLYEAAGIEVGDLDDIAFVVEEGFPPVELG